MRLTALFVLLFSCGSLCAQEDYEIQVYASPTMDKGVTIFEWHSNFTVDGSRDVKNGVRPDYHAFHGTLEITHGISKHFELGLYFFTNATSPYGWQFVGTHIRPRVSVPDSWHWPVGASLSTEFGYQRSEYSPETWNIEIRPIIDKQLGRWYLCFNPSFGIGIKSNEPEKGPAFEPNAKAAYSLSDKISIGTEYYGDLGPVNDFESGSEQSHSLYAVVDLFVDPRWEFNAGPGWGLTPASKRLLVKVILGRRINWSHHPSTQQSTAQHFSFARILHHS